MTGNAPVWVLLGQKTGDNNQLLRLAEAIGLPFQPIELRYNALHWVPPKLLGKSLASLAPGSRALLRPPWPRLVLGIGHRSVAPALAIREASAGQASLVRLGNPRHDPGAFELVITTSQYPVPDAGNVIRLPLGISTSPVTAPNEAETQWLAALPRPHRLLLVGGRTFMWRLSGGRVAAVAKQLASKGGGTVIAVSSPRSETKVVDAVAQALADRPHQVVRNRFPRYPVLLQDADEIHVTADSIAMISDAVATGKPVGLVMPRNTIAGRFFYGLSGLGVPVPVRDISRIWAFARKSGLAGTVDRPVAGSLDPNPLETAVKAVRSLLD